MLVVPIAAGTILGLVAYCYILADDRRWLLVAIFSHVLLFVHSSSGGNSAVTPIALTDILFSVVFFPGLALWFFRRIRSRDKIVEGWADVVVFVFLVYAFLSIGLAAYQGFSVEKGIREFLLFVPLLLIFPVRREAKKNKGAQLIVWTLLLTSVTVGLVIVVRYKLDLMAAHYLWQVISNRQQKEESLYMSSIIILLAFLVGNKYSKTLNLFLIGIELFSLAITFSRGYWITTFLGVVASTFFMRGKARKRLLALMVGGGLLSAAVAFLLLPHIFGSLITGIIERAGSISPDALTIRSRLVESEAALGKFVRNPVIGYGMGALFTFYNILTNESLRTWYIHNAYVFLLFKFGIVGFIMFLSMYFKRVSELWELWKRKLETPDNSFVTALLLIPLMMLFISGTSPQFFDRGSLMILAIVWGIGESMLEGAA